jgi:uncharacterized protein (TIGR02145 family)
MGDDSNAGGNNSSSGNGGGQVLYLYCVNSVTEVCTPGSFTECPLGEAPKDECPDGFSKNTYGGVQQYLYCVNPAMEACTTGPVTECPPGEVPKDECPAGYSKDGNNNNNGGKQDFLFCVYPDTEVCVPGPVTECQSGGTPKDECPADFLKDYNRYYRGLIVYEGQSYRTVKIGTQTWMAENLNYNVAGSKCYNNDEANCVAYGRLYDWTTAMTLPTNCNSTYCVSQNIKYRGICPANWHIPSQAEFIQLLRYVEDVNSMAERTDGYISNTAGKYLKATSGWNWEVKRDYVEDSDPNGIDTYGFSAIPSGGAHLGDLCTPLCFSGFGYRASFWGTGEGNDLPSSTWNHESYAYRLFINTYDNSQSGPAHASVSYVKKEVYISVRCIKD